MMDSNRDADFEPSTPESRAAHETRRAEDYPLPDERLEPLRRALRDRLVAAGVSLPPPAEFEALVLDMARFALRWSWEEVGTREADRRETAQGEEAERHQP